MYQVTTMDTTSHNFTWQTFTFGGEAGSCTLYDVAIIDENNIWAVGAIYLKDSAGNYDPNAYNAVHWNGVNWELKRIEYHGSCSGVKYPPLKAIWAFSENNIVITNGGSFGWFDGNKVKLDCIVNPLLTGAINKIWASSNNNLYAVGNKGNIIHYQNGRWQKIESGTDLNINDIWGDFNEKTGEWEVLAVASNILQSYEKEVIEIKNNNSELLNKEGINWTLSSVWFKPNRKYYVVGSGIYEKSNLRKEEWKGDSPFITTYHVNKIKGKNSNNIFIAGAFGELLHFNGVSWKSYINETGFNGTLLSLDVNKDLICAVGYEGAQAKIIISNKK